MAIVIGPGITIGPGIGITAEPAAASGSANFVSASTQYLSATSTATGTSAATYEWWFYLNQLPPSQYGMFNNRGTNGTGATGLDVFVDTNGQVLMTTSSGTTYVVGTGVVTANTWNHVAIARGTGPTTWRGYLNGTQGVNSSASTNTSTAIYIGQDPNTQYTSIAPFNGYISNFRYVLGVRVYTGTFTVPTSPLQATQAAGTNISAITAGQTRLLLNTVNGGGFLTDSSGLGVSVTNNNGVTSSALNPFGL
jgi:hypothetical protein